MPQLRPPLPITFVDWADLHRWKMINKALDLPFDNPQETYSTSEHLFHDQGIPAGTKGRVVDPAPVEKKPTAPPAFGLGRGKESPAALVLTREQRGDPKWMWENDRAVKEAQAAGNLVYKD